MGPGGADDRPGGVGFADLHALSDSDRTRAVAVVGVPQQVSSRGLVEALPIATRWADSLPESEAGLESWGAKVADDPEFAALMYRTLLTGEMGGQLFVRDIEVPEAGTRTAALAAVTGEAFFALPFEEAIQAFLARRLISPEEYRQMSARARAMAFSVSRMTSTELVKRVQSVLGRTLEDGGTYREFVASVRTGEVDLGITSTNPGYLANIFRTNTASSYGAGRLRQLTDPVVVAARPFLEFRTARDSRVSTGPEGHAQLEGVVFEQSDPGWREFSPPLRWQCRCGIVARRSEDVDRSRVVAASSLPRITAPGFGG